MSTGGDCYEVAGRFMMDKCMLGNNDCNLVLVHGEVMGQGAIAGIPYGHAWILDGSTVIDKSNGRNLSMPMQVYYALGQIDRIDNVIEYPWEEARAKILEHGTWGPWDLETSSGY